MEFKPIETQEQFNEMIQDRIARAQEKVREEYSDYEDIKQQVSNYQNQINELTTKLENAGTEKDSLISELTTKVQKYESDSVKIKAAHKYGIPFEMASRISGTDEESIMKDAEAIAPLFKQKSVPPLANPIIGNAGVDGSLINLSRKLTER